MGEVRPARRGEERASTTACAGVKADALVPKRARAPASSPKTPSSQLDHVEVQRQDSPLRRARSIFAASTASLALRQRLFSVPSQRFFASCCVSVEAPRA